MNLVRYLVTTPLLVALSLSGCKATRPDGTTAPPGESDPVSGPSTESPSTASTPTGNSTTSPEPQAVACEAQVADAPTPLFDESVLIRPPINVELTVANPTLATTYAEDGYVSACEAVVDRMSILVSANDKERPLSEFATDIIDKTLAGNGFTNGTRGTNPVDTDTALHTTMRYPAADGNPPVVIYIAIARKYNYILTTLFETRPDDFALLEPTFKKSAESLLVIPPS